MNLLFVCTGNTCRSAMAQGIAKKMIQDNPKRYQEIKVASAGTYSQTGERASSYAQDIARENGVDLSDFEASQVTPELLDEADLILAMTGSHKMLLNTLNPAAIEKIFLLKEYEYGENINQLNVKLHELFEEYGAVRENFVKGHQTELQKLDQLSNEQDQAAAEDFFNTLNGELMAGVKVLDEEVNEIDAKLKAMEISDPIGGEMAEYRQCYQQLADSIAVVLEKIVSQAVK